MHFLALVWGFALGVDNECAKVLCGWKFCDVKVTWMMALLHKCLQKMELLESKEDGYSICHFGISTSAPVLSESKLVHLSCSIGALVRMLSSMRSGTKMPLRSRCVLVERKGAVAKSPHSQILHEATSRRKEEEWSLVWVLWARQVGR